MYLLIVALALTVIIPLTIWICVYPVYWVFKKMKRKLNSLNFNSFGGLGPTLSFFINGIYIFFFGVLGFISVLYSFYLIGNYIFPFFKI